MRLKVTSIVILLLGIGFYLILPASLFKKPKASLMVDEHGQLLSARIADDEQWRFPDIDSVPKKLAQCILYFEDEYFHYHPGVNPVSLFRAVGQNLSSGKIVSGGSTLSMQLIRLSRENPPRTYLEKIWEMILAVRLEFGYSKEEILELYASNAPYGGNVVGLETASWRYFNRAPNHLSWSESAMLAVLPNSPSLIHLGKNRDLLKKKRNRLLKKLLVKEVIDSMTYSLSILEEIPNKPEPLPNHAYHLLSKAMVNGFEGKRIHSTLDRKLQVKLTEAIDRYVALLAQNEVHNACAMVISLKDQSVKAYVGNSMSDHSRSPYVDLIQAPRSSGSILKPLLYGKSIEKGMIHSSSLLKDVPISINNYAPKNFDGEFEGVVTASKALSKSLNVPATLLLRDYGIAPFYSDLKQFGLSAINRPAGSYGLTLIIGGAEVSLAELAAFYAFQAQKLNDPDFEKNLVYWEGDQSVQKIRESIDPGAWWLITEALQEVERPGINMDWKSYSSSRRLAWKTGTSQGFRDAWAIGYDADHLVAVWVGNADGEGRPGLTGVSAAGPLLFDIFQLLPKGNWFEKPEYYLKEQLLCSRSGYLAGPNCPVSKEETPYFNHLNTDCNYHQRVLLNEAGEQVFRDCSEGTVKDSSIFYLDPVAGYYYHQKHKSEYIPLKLAASCSREIKNTLGIIYPTDNARLIIPTNFSGEKERVIFTANHTVRDQSIYWHLDEKFLGTTQGVHELACLLSPGKHKLLIMDSNGNRDHKNFEVFVD